MIRSSDDLFSKGQWSEWLPALPAQRGHIAVDEITRGAARPMVHHGLLIEGAFDRARLAAVIDWVTDRYDALRLRFATVNGQVLTNAFAGQSELIDVSVEGATDEDRVSNIGPFCAERMDVDAGRSVFWCLDRQAPDRHLLILVVHHALLDALSKVIVLQDVAEAYANGIESVAPVTADSCQQVTLEMGREAKGDAAEAAEAFWRDYLRGGARDLGADMVRADGDGPSFDRIVCVDWLEPEATRALFERAKPYSKRPFVIWSALLAQCFAADQAALVLVPTSSRDRPGRRRAVGCFTRTMPVRLFWEGEETFARLGRDLNRMLEHVVLTTEDLVAREILPFQGMLTAPIATQFQVRAAYPPSPIDRPECRLRLVGVISGVRNLQPIAMSVLQADSPELSIEVDTGLADPAKAAAMIERVKAVLAG